MFKNTKNLELEQNFKEEDIQMANKDMKKGLGSLATMKMKIRKLESSNTTHSLEWLNLKH